MNKTERKSRVSFEINYHMNELQKSKSGYWATRHFEYLSGILNAFYSIGEITEAQCKDFQSEALSTLSEVRIQTGS